MPLCEIEERFCKSELGIIGWRSQEVAYHMDKKMKKGSAEAGPSEEARAHFNDPSLPTSLPERFFNKEGELDLRGVTGADALKFLGMQGVNVPMVPPRALAKEEDGK